MSIKRIQVAMVDRVEGTSFTFSRKYSTVLRTFQGVEGMMIQLGDIIETDKHTTIQILFHVGGLIHVLPGEKVEVTGHREIVVIAFDQALRSQRLKEEFKQEIDEELEKMIYRRPMGTAKRIPDIRRAGGVIGIRG